MAMVGWLVVETDGRDDSGSLFTLVGQVARELGEAVPVCLVGLG